MRLSWGQDANADVEHQSNKALQSGTGTCKDINIATQIMCVGGAYACRLPPVLPAVAKRQQPRALMHHNDALPQQLSLCMVNTRQLKRLGACWWLGL